MRMSAADAHEVPMFSSTYAWVRSVKCTTAVPDPARRSQSISMSRCCISCASASASCAARDAVAAHDDALVRDVDALGIEPRAARAELRQHPAPVGIVAVERALHELAAGDGPRRGAGLGVRSARPAPRRVASLVAPSASAAICCARSAHAAVSASVNASYPGLRAGDRLVAERAVREHEHGVVGAACSRRRSAS